LRTVYVRDGYVMLGRGQGSKTLGLELSDGEIHDAILTLQDAIYVDFNSYRESRNGAHFTNFAITGRGQQALGEWPLFDTIVSPETLALMLERLAEEAPTDEEAGSLRLAAAYVRTLSGATLRAFVSQAMSAAIRGSLGLG